MKTATVVILFTALLTWGIVITLGGDKVRGEDGQGEVHQEMVDSNYNW